MCRFSDEALQQFYDEFSIYKKEFDSHVKTFSEHIEKEDKNWEIIMEHIEETKGLLDLYETGLAGKKIAGWILNLAKWLAGMGIFVGLYHYLLEHFKS